MTHNTIQFPSNPRPCNEIGRELTPAERNRASIDSSLHAFHSVLESIRNGVFVLADDISPEQKAEIERELSIMDMWAKLAREARGMPDIPGTVHLMRDEEAQS